MKPRDGGGKWRPTLGAAPRRGERTEPGVSTPGLRPQPDSPCRGDRTNVVNTHKYQVADEPYIQPRTPRFCRPYRAEPILGLIPGVETPGSVLLPLRGKSFQEPVNDFGTRVKSHVKPGRTLTAYC